jgi:hypothetical protein
LQSSSNSAIIEEKDWGIEIMVLPSQIITMSKEEWLQTEIAQGIIRLRKKEIPRNIAFYTSAGDFQQVEELKKEEADIEEYQYLLYCKLAEQLRVDLESANNGDPKAQYMVAKWSFGLIGDYFTNGREAYYYMDLCVKNPQNYIKWASVYLDFFRHDFELTDDDIREITGEVQSIVD